MWLTLFLESLQESIKIYFLLLYTYIFSNIFEKGVKVPLDHMFIGKDAKSIILDSKSVNYCDIFQYILFSPYFFSPQ